MTIVKNLLFADKKLLKNWALFEESELNFSDFKYFPFDFIHSFLPFGLKFMNETFVSIENEKINGLITVCKADLRHAKLSKLLLDENSLEAGKLLVNYVVNLYLSKGAEFFHIPVERENNSLITMLKDGCGFQSFAKEVVYKIERKENDINLHCLNLENIKKLKFSEIDDVCALINNAMFSYQRNIFAKNPANLKKSLLLGHKHFVLLDKTKSKIVGYFKISKSNNKVYSLDLVIEKGYEIYSLDMIKFAGLMLSFDKNFEKLYVKLKSYYFNFKELNEIFELEFKEKQEREILVKTYLTTRKTPEFEYGKMLLNDATPAF